MDAALIEAYRGTEYRVSDGQPFTLLIDVPCDPLRALYASLGACSAAFITAYNPMSRPSSDDQNVRRQADLSEALRRRGLVHLAGIGQHPTGAWPGEPSLLVLGLDLDEAEELGRAFEQNAVIWCGSDTVPRLILLR